MNLLQFIKILRSNLLVLIFVPLLMALLVVFFTKDSPKNYVTKTKIYTGIASGYSLESQQNTSFNYFAINNAFDNLINLVTSRSTIEETGLRLYALHLVQDEPRMPIMTLACMKEMKRITPPEVFELVDKKSLEQTYQNLLAFKNKDESNYVYKLINFNHNHYSYNAIAKIKARRVANSDIVEITFESDDPAVCYQTVNILTEVFTGHYSKLKENQTDAVVKYFEEQLLVSQGKLQVSENKLLQFNMDNKIINYYEQTKHVASTNEKYETERQTVLLELAASESVIKNLEANMGTRMKIKLQGNSIISMRGELNKLNEQISLQRFSYADSSLSNDEVIQELVARSEKLKENLRKSVDSLHLLENTNEGIEVQQVLNNWLKNVIAYEEAKAKLQALEIRRIELEETIKHFAPLGANLKKIEREIDVVEREYLSLLYSLGLAKLKQQDIELSSNIKVVDPPVLPSGPLPSKRKFLVIAAAFAGFVLTLGFIFLVRFFDTTLQNTQRAEKVTGLKGFGNYPLLNKNGKSACNEDLLRDISANSIVNYIFENRSDTKLKSYRIGFLSNFKGEGKTELIGAISKKMEAVNKSCRRLPAQFNPSAGIPSVQDNARHHPEPEFELIEVPSLIGNIMTDELMNRFDLFCYVIRADRAWERADQNMLGIIRKVAGNSPVGFILNAVKQDHLTDFIGQIPKKRSRLRRFIKRIVLFRFFESFDLDRSSNV